MPRAASRRAVKNAGLATGPTRTLGPQLLLHDEAILRSEPRPVQNDLKALAKPRGGLWTSTYNTIYGSAWVCWCVAYRYNEPFDLHWTVLSAAQLARVTVIDTKADLAALIERYPRTLAGRRSLDFEHLANEYDGLHLTNDGYLSTRSTRSGAAFIGWDCESTLWFRWIFSEWHEVTPGFKDVHRFDDLWLRLSGWSTEDYTAIACPRKKHRRKFTRRCLARRLLSQERRRDMPFDLPDIAHTTRLG